MSDPPIPGPVKSRKRPKVPIVIAGAVGAVVVVTLIAAVWAYCYYAIPVRSVLISKGTVGPFQIGETKESLLSRLQGEIYSPEPKPSQCPANWIEVSKASDTEKTCLLSTSVWIEGVSSTRRLFCPERVDVVTTLEFREDRLVSVATVCRHPM
jgi:hypothetical protein